MSLFRKARDNGSLLLLSTGSIVLTITLALGVTLGLPLLKVQSKVERKPCDLIMDTNDRRVQFQDPVLECDLVSSTPIIAGHQNEINNADSVKPHINMPLQNLKLPLKNQESKLIPNRVEINRATKFVGKYERTPVKNNWHKVELVIENNQLIWINAAKVSWRMSFENDILRKADNTSYPAQALKYREEEGSVLMIMFQREAYFRVDIDNSLKDKSKYSKKKFLGHFQRRPVENGYHDIEVILKGDVLFWVTKIGSQWELEYDGKTLRKSDNTIYNEQDLDYRSLNGVVQAIIFQSEYFYRL